MYIYIYIPLRGDWGSAAILAPAQPGLLSLSRLAAMPSRSTDRARGRPKSKRPASLRQPPLELSQPAQPAQPASLRAAWEAFCQARPASVQTAMEAVSDLAGQQVDMPLPQPVLTALEAQQADMPLPRPVATALAALQAHKSLPQSVVTALVAQPLPEAVQPRLLTQPAKKRARPRC